MPTSTAPPPPNLPIPIFQPSSSIPRYLLYDISHITYLRSHHAILGVLIGSLPQIPQQSVFLGLPLELQPEEAQLLVDKGVGYIVNDREWHDVDFRQKSGQERQDIIQRLRDEGMEIAKGLRTMRKERTAQILEERKAGKVKKASGREAKAKIEEKGDREEQPAPSASTNNEGNANSDEPNTPAPTEEPHLFTPPPSRSRSNSTDPTPHLITPTTSTSLSPTPPPPPNAPSNTLPTLLTPTLTKTYPLFAHLHSQGYYLSPGLRFGCHFSVYPGDPLRFHSHFLANALGWDEEFDLVDLVGGGRLGTGVKKGWLIGGEVEEGPEAGGEGRGEVMCFCVEWGGM